MSFISSLCFLRFSHHFSVLLIWTNKADRSACVLLLEVKTHLWSCAWFVSALAPLLNEATVPSLHRNGLGDVTAVMMPLLLPVFMFESAAGKRCRCATWWLQLAQPGDGLTYGYHGDLRWFTPHQLRFCFCCLMDPVGDRKWRPVGGVAGRSFPQSPRASRTRNSR